MRNRHPAARQRQHQERVIARGAGKPKFHQAAAKILARLAAVGYTPALDHNQYPVAILAAEKRVRENAVAQNAPGTAPAAATSGYGSEARTAGESGRVTTINGRDSIYRGH